MFRFFQHIKNFFKKLLSLWTIYGGVGLSLLITWWTNFAKNQMEMWATYLTLLITCIGLLTFLKTIFLRNKKSKAKVPVIIKNNRVAKIDKAMFPEENGKELGEIIIHSVEEGKAIMSKVGKFFKWLWGNKFTLTSIVSNLVVTAVAQYMLYSDMLMRYEFFATHKVWFIVGVTTLCVLWLIDNIFCVVSKYGLENLNELKERSEKKKQEAIEKLSPEQKVALKEVVKKLKEQRNELKLQLLGIDEDFGKFEKVINDFNLLEKIGVAHSQEQITECEQAKAKIADLKVRKNQIERAKENVELEIDKVKAKL